MAKEYTPEELVNKTFWITMVGVGLFIVVVFLFFVVPVAKQPALCQAAR